MNPNTFGAVILLLIAIVIAALVYISRWLYRRSTKETAFVRTGFLGEKVVINGGAFVIPVLREITPVNMNVARMTVRICRVLATARLPLLFRARPTFAME